ncbi:MAG: tryptophan synthase subunit alpha [Dethiobacteria bacterium]|jgi:tryptophan synthase alpha chain
MSKLQQVFSKGKAFIPFITAGDPSLEVTEQLMFQMAEAGADLIELGIPFSDPIAEGPVIQAASERALAAGTTTDKILAMVGRMRKSCQVPVALMTYVNSIFTYGTERFLKKCQKVGIAAVVVPDVPFEEKGELLPYCTACGVDLISMIAPTSNRRIRMIVSEAQGFVYCVSSLGVTGVRQKIGSVVEQMIKQVKEVKEIPCAIGFGVSHPEQAGQLARFADGIIVGSAIVKIIGQYGTGCVPHVGEYVRSMKNSIM